MNIVKKSNNVYYYSFLISGRRNLFLNFSNIENKIFNEITSGNKTIKQISKLLNINIEFVVNFVNKLINIYDILYFDKNQINKQRRNAFDRHDLFFDLNFQIEDFTKKYIENKNILIIGCGGIGNNIVSHISRSGVNNFILVDDDKIELTNLTRQFLFYKDDIDKYKVDVLKKQIKKINSKANILKIKSKFSEKILEKILKNNKVDFAFVSADNPQTIAIDAYQIFSKYKIPFTTVGYLNDFGILGPIIDKPNLKYEKFVNLSKTNKKVQKMNMNYQAPSFGPLNSFVSSIAVYDMFQYFVKKEECKTYNKKLIINFNTLLIQSVEFDETKIGVFNSSSNLSSLYPDRVKETADIFKNNQLQVTLGNLTFKSDTNYRSGTIKERAKEFNDLAKKSNILISMIGGFNSSSILDLIDYEYLKVNKIKVVGCSDTTALLLAIYKQTKLPVYYGVSFLKNYNEQEYIKNFNLDILFDRVIQDFPNYLKLPKKITFEKVDWKYNKVQDKKLIENKLKILNNNNSKVIGRLLGGNLNTMASLIGTKYMPDFEEGDILFIEDSNVNIDIVERNISVLKNANILDKVSCIIIGLIEDYNDFNSKKQYYEVLLEFIDKEIPIILNFPCSHIQPSTILKIGAKMEVDLKNETFLVLE